MKLFTHAELVSRGARWARNTYGCKVVLTENESYSGETPDVIGWKRNGRSILIECKTSRPDFLADAKKPFRANTVIALGAERYYMTNVGLLKPEELPEGWGLVEVKGNGCKVVVPCRPRKDLRSDQARNYEMRMLVDALNRVSMRLAPAQLNEWLQYEHRNTTAGQMQTWVSSEDHQIHLAAQQGFELVINPADLPDDEATSESWCPKHEMLFESCSCIGPNEQHVIYAEVDGHLMGKPMAMHAFKFPQRVDEVGPPTLTVMRDIPESDLQRTYIGYPCTLDDMAAALKS
jgi:hypothetical protein